MTLVLNGSVGVSDVDGSAATPAIRGTDANTGMFFPAADTIAFAEGGAEVMRIDSAGNVGIGTSSPSGKLDVVATSATSYFNVRSSSIANSAQVVQDTGGTAYFQNTYASGDVIFGTAGNNAIFKTSSTERARIDTSGNLLVGTTNALPINNRNNGFVIKSNGSWIARFPSSNTDVAISTTSGNLINFYSDNGSTAVYSGSISVNGNVNTYGSVSDYRLKDNVQDLIGSLSKIIALRPVTFTFSESGQDSEGFIAHELQAVIPKAVVGEKDAVKEDGNPDYQQVDASKIIVHLVAAIQELKAEKDALKARVEALENV